jgi:WD40 repeat protein
MKSHKARGSIRHLPESLSALIVFAVLTTAAYAQPATPPERLKHTLTGHSGPIRAVEFSPDGQTLVSVDWDGTLILWNALTGEIKRSIKNDREKYRDVAFSPDGQTIISGSQIREGPEQMSKMGMVTLWDAQTGEIRRKFNVGPSLGILPKSGGVLSVAYSPDGKIFAAGMENATIKIWDAQTGKELRVLGGRDDPVESIAFSSDGLTLASGSRHGALILWDTKSWKAKQKIKLNNAMVRSVAFSPDSKTLAGSISLTVKNTLPSLVTTDSLPNNGVNMSGVSGYEVQATGGVVKLWDIETGKVALELANSQNIIPTVAFSPDGRTVANAVHDKTVRLVTVKNGEILTLRDHTGPVIAVAFSPDGRTLASAGADKTVKLWDVSDSRTTR